MQRSCSDNVTFFLSEFKSAGPETFSSAAFELTELDKATENTKAGRHFIITYPLYTSSISPDPIVAANLARRRVTA